MSPVLSEGAKNIRASLGPEEQAIFDERLPCYGDPIDCHENIGAAWAALLSQHYRVKLASIPADIVALMMVQFKAIRAVSSYKQDNYQDLKTYAAIADGARKAKP